MLAQAHGESQNSDAFRRLSYGCTRKLSAGKAKKKKGVFWGIEVTKTLRWHGWEVGKETIKHLILKNVHEKTQKLSYRCPSTRFFFTVFPQPIILRPGMSLTLPIIFRPIEKREYEDNICFKKDEGEFSVTLRATLPHPCLSFPAAVQLPACAVHDVMEITFPVRNIGDLVTVFHWETPSPFYMIPNYSILNPGAECMVKVVFQPKVAAVYDVAATCWFGSEEKRKRTIQLKALSKYPYLQVNVVGEEKEDVQPGKFQDVLCFGSVPVGTTVEKCVEIFNMSVVDAPCRIERAEDPLLQDHVFSCDVSHGIVPAKGKLVLCIRFQPQIVGEHSTDYFTITSAGYLLQTVLKVTGSCKGPSVSLHQDSLDFDWINLGQSLMRMLEISNTSDVPAYYQFDIGVTGSVFSLDRPCGVLEGTTTLALKVTFRPTHPISYHRRVVCLVHHQEPLYVDFFGTCHSDTAKPAILQARHLSWYRTNTVRGLTFYPPDIVSAMLKDGQLQMDEKGALMLLPEEIVLQSCGESLNLLLEGEGNLYFKPVYIGTSFTRMYTIKNCTRLPMVFTWKIRQSDSKILSVSPTAGILQPYEAMAQAWTFTPDKEIKYLLRAKVFVRRKKTDPVCPETVCYALRIVGEGALGTIRAEKEHLDLGNVLVGDLQSCTIVLLNDGICSLKYILSVEQLITGPPDTEEVRNDPLALELEYSRGTIPARSRAFVQVTVRPARRLHYTWSIKYALCTPTATDLTRTEEEQQPLCCIVATGVYPTFCITDACSAGSGSGISKLHLWRLFSLDILNKYLKQDPTPSELIYRVPTRHSTCLSPPAYTPLLLDFNFGAAPIGSEPTLVMLLLENKGVVPVEWAFLFPSDQKLDMEHWAEDAEFSSRELHEMRIQDNQLFSVSPKSGKLLPGQEESIQLSHRHDFTGIDRLPVLLKVSYGREILLNFSGVTVEEGQQYIHFTSSKHLFTPIAIGTSHPPTQIYELYNGGSVPVIFEVQLDEVMKIQKENFQHPVFVCLTPRGEIPPGITGHIEWIFSPLEARTYMVDVPIHILGGESAVITFKGEGYNPNTVEGTASSSKVLLPSVFSGSTKLTVPGQAATLSHRRICFGNIPDCAKASRLVFLNNISESKTVVFAWQISTCKDKRMLQIAPEVGVVQPGESIPCFITLQPSGTASFCSTDLVCELYIQESLAQYKRELQEWEKEKARQAVEFTITEKDLGKQKSPAGRSSGSAETEILPESSAVMRRYKTLPPIKNHPTPNQPAGHVDRRRLLDKESSWVWIKPEPPKPILLHLGVTATAYSLEDFFNKFTSELHKYFLFWPFSDQRLETKFVDGRRDKNRMEMEPKRLSLAAASKQELQIVTDILAGVIRGLLENTQLHDAVRSTLDEPIPYFSQFRCAESAELQDRRQCSTVPSGVSASPDLYPEKDEERKQMRQETSPNNDWLEISHHEQLREQKEMISRQPAFRSLVELVLENTLQNILIEASCGEVVLTAQPRVIALPSSPSQRPHGLAGSLAVNVKAACAKQGIYSKSLCPFFACPKPQSRGDNGAAFPWTRDHHAVQGQGPVSEQLAEESEALDSPAQRGFLRITSPAPPPPSRA
ncbi:cilia- and flagella-associated protein 65 isoform X8 [Pezoporus flaviventris]|uniref:cilia- and flagella-associated protein 65 isoform X8 n=1 Tax=Pezoporus flaviventris TaxID=889875 RepID=UPI002AAF3313|nr:cilia- and flagella-associated protein 65 isoform X8 [Pezoporus flaviventris]